MTVGEMFISIGVKGADKATKQVKEVEKSMQELKGVTLETKVAVLAMAYGLEQLTAKAMTFGAATTNFSAQTGINRKFFEDITWGMEKFGVASADTESTLRGVQSRIQDIRMGAGTSGLFQTFMKATGFNQNRMTDMPYVMNKLKDYEKMPDSFDKQKFFAALGVTPGFMGGLHIANQSGHAPDFEHLQRSAIGMGDKEAMGMLNQKAAWSQMWEKFEVNFGRKLAPEAQSAQKPIEHLLDAVTNMAAALLKLEQAFGIFDKLTLAIDKLSDILDIFSGSSKSQTAEEQHKKGLFQTPKEHLSEAAKNRADFAKNPLKSIWHVLTTPNVPTMDMNEAKKHTKDALDLKNKFKDSLHGPKAADKSASNTLAPTINIYTDTNNPKQLAKMVGDEMKVAAYNMAAVVQVS